VVILDFWIAYWGFHKMFVVNKYIAVIVAILLANVFSQEPVLVTGTATNPLIKADVPDVSIVRVGNAYYMVSTTMYFAPVAPVMKSYDLVNWRIVSYCADILEDLPSFRLGSENATSIGEYSRGQWAASIRYYQSRFWVMFANNTTGKTYLFHTENADTGPWTRIEFNRQFHDPSLFYDESNSKLYVISGYHNITLTELNLDASAVKAGGTSKTILNENSYTVLGGTVSGTEGSQAYFRNGYYYIVMITWLNGMRTVICARTQDLVNGPYEIRQILRSGLGSRGDGVAQGGIVDTPDGEWYGLFFQDRGAIGRVPVLVPMTWSNDNWPTFPTNVPETLNLKLAQNYGQYVYASDEFSGSKLSLVWQWNHNPDNNNWSLTEKPGYLRLKTVGTPKTIFHARNTLTQRTIEPESEAIVLLEPTSMKDGDKAGLMVLQSRSGLVGIEQEAGQKYIVMYVGDNETEANRGQNAIETRSARVAFTGDKIYLKAECKFRIPGRNAETAVFSYSLDGVTWTSIGSTVNLVFNYQTHFTGARFGLFNYAKQTAGGYVDFDYFRLGGSLGGIPDITATCNLNNLASSYVAGSSIPRPNITCSDGSSAGTASFVSNGSDISGWASTGGTHAFYNEGTRTVTLNSVVCGSTTITPNIACSGSFEIVPDPTSIIGGGVLANSTAPVEIYDLKGNKVVKESLPSGVYIAKARGMRSKVFVVR
jgi:beta-xylosidase